MTTLHIDLPDPLAEEAAKAGLLDADKIEALLREQLRARRLERLSSARQALAADPPPPMTPAEIQAEIDAYRSGQRRAPDS